MSFPFFGALFLAIALVFIGVRWYRLAMILAGFKARIITAGVLGSGRTLEDVMGDIQAKSNIATRGSVDIDTETGAVRVSALLIGSRRAIYKEGLGTVLEARGMGEDLLAYAGNTDQPSVDYEALAFPAGELVVNEDTEVNIILLNRAIDDAFRESNAERPQRTRAVVVVHDGQIVGERYADGFHRDMPLECWTIAEFVMNALIGILVQQGKLDVKDLAPVDDWQGNEQDMRKIIMIEHLLQGQSGLAFPANKSVENELQKMMFGSVRKGAYAHATAMKLDGMPGTEWAYNPIAALILSGIMRTILRNSQAYLEFPKRALFDRIGMRHTTIDPDEMGIFQTSFYMLATARDCARLGLLYLNDGIWNGERILPEGWVDYSTTPAEHAPMKEYGALLWLNAGAGMKDAEQSTPSDPPFHQLPADTYFAKGFDGQSITMIPSRKLVVVRLGLSVGTDAWNLEGFVEKILRAVPASVPERSIL